MLAAIQQEVEALRAAYEASEARFRALIENSADVVAITDGEGAVVYVSTSVERMLGYTPQEVVGQLGFDFVHPDDVAGMRELFVETVQSEGTTYGGPFRARHKDGSWRRLESVGKNLVDNPAVRGVVYTLRDVTKQHELEQRLRQSERLEAVGQLAGGVAHDFNNILLVIRGYSSVLRAAVDDPALAADVDEISRAADRAAQLTRQLLAFSRRQVLQTSPLDVCDVVFDMEKLLRRSIREDIEMIFDMPAEIAPVLADAGQMEQVLLNLVVNARDAMPDGGTIELSIAPAELDRRCDVQPPVEPGSYVALSVSDSGEGIPPDVLPRIFEPFFTTKRDGLGTGLGLSTVYGIVGQSGGGIAVTALPAGGTRMTVFLPVAAGVEVDDEELEDGGVLRLPAGSETILLVEDEAPVRELVRRVLEDVGYEVHAASRPSEAQRLVTEHEFDLLLTDVVMPEMSGYDLATRVRLAQPKARTLFMSGYAHQALGELDEQPEGELLRKPFSPEQLTATVRAVLDGSVLTTDRA